MAHSGVPSRESIGLCLAQPWLQYRNSTSHAKAKLSLIFVGLLRAFKKILFPRDVALRTTYLDDVRFDLRRGKGDMYVTNYEHNPILRRMPNGLKG